MSWFSGSTVNVVELDNKISEATSEAIPNGEIDLAIGLEITDLIRSKNIPPKQCMRCLKKRLTTTYANPNLLSSSLKLIDLAVKNGGYHFLVEISSKEFMDYLVDFILKVHYNPHDSKITSNQAKYNVSQYILTLIKSWTTYFKSQLQLNYVEKCYNDLLKRGYEFPDIDYSEYLNGTFIDSETPADWVDSDECMICYKAFSMLNRKHHCRSCGGVYCHEHSSHNAPLPSLGITEPVRVCDNCYHKIKSKNSEGLKIVQNDHQRSMSATDVDDEDEQLRKAIELSLKESGGIETAGSAPQAAPIREPEPAPQPDNIEEEDPEMKAAIAASLKEFESQEKMHKLREEQQRPTETQTIKEEEPQSSFYDNVLPFEQQSNPFVDSQVDNSSRERLTPSAHIEKHKPQVNNEFSQQDEETINLYITLMNGVRNDPTRANNILYDKDLAQLHARINQLKPKLNKSLRSSIEKYESFVALNNKISTITRLYDQFLESKLDQVYGGGFNTIANYNTMPYPMETPQDYSNMSRQQTGISYDNERPQDSYYYQQPPQATQGSQPDYPEQAGRNYTGQDYNMSSNSNVANESPYRNYEAPQAFEPSEPLEYNNNQYRESSPVYNTDPNQSVYSSQESQQHNQPPPLHPQYSHHTEYPPPEQLEAHLTGQKYSFSPQNSGMDPQNPPDQFPPYNATGNSIDAATSRYPSIGEFDNKYPSAPTGAPTHAVPSEPSIPTEPMNDLSIEENRRKTTTEEPLIDL